MASHMSVNHSHQPQPALISSRPLNHPPHLSNSAHTLSGSHPTSKQKARGKRSEPAFDSGKRRCVSTACIACRKRKSKCDGNTPACAACSSVYGTECIYDPKSDHRRKGVYRQDIDNLKDRSSTLQILIEALLNASQDDVPDLVRQIRNSDSLDTLAQRIEAKDRGLEDDDSEPESPIAHEALTDGLPSLEAQLSSKLGQLRVDSGSTRFFGGTSNLVYFGETARENEDPPPSSEQYHQHPSPVTSWTSVTSDPELIVHLLNMYFTWHYTFFVTLSKSAFYQHFMLGRPHAGTRRKVEYCTPLLVNAMLALGCHFTARPEAMEDPDDPSTAGDHFFKEAKRLIREDEEYEHPKLANVQALALMSVREAGCGREAKGWTFSGIAFRMACDLGLNLDSGGLASQSSALDEQEEDARRMTFWGCFLFDKCWSNYLGRLPHFQSTVNITCSKFDVFPDEEAANWTPYSDSGFAGEHTQPSRVRTVGRHLMDLCDISSDLMKYFYHPQEVINPPSKQAEIKRLSEIHTRLESWRRAIPSELDPREGALPSVFVMHMFFHLLYVHLFRPFLKYDPKSSPLPSNVSPRRQCTHGAAAISKLLRLYKRSYGLRQICNIVVYIAHSACTIHLLNLPDKNAKRDINHGVKQLEEIANSWPCARRTLSVLSKQARKWKIELPDEAAAVLQKLGGDSAGNSSSGSSPHAMAKGNNADGEFDAQRPSISQDQDQDHEMWNGGLGPMHDQSLLADLDASLASMVSQNPASFGFMTAPTGAFASDSYTSADHVDTDDHLHATSSVLTSPGSGTISPQQQQMAAFSWPQTTAESNNTAATSGGNDEGSFPQRRGIHGDPARASQREQAAARQHQASMQPPPLPRSQMRINVDGRASSQPPATAQSPSKPTTALSQDQSGSRPATRYSLSGRRPSATDNMFGGVQALLSESQDFWLKDQSKIASGFGNWRTGGGQPSVPSTPTGESSSMTTNGILGGPSPASSTASTASTAFHVDTHCAVADPAGLPCARGLDCDVHPLHAKRAVAGRSRPYDMLLGAEMARRWEAERRRRQLQQQQQQQHDAGSSAVGSGAGASAGATDDEWCG